MSLSQGRNAEAVRSEARESAPSTGAQMPRRILHIFPTFAIGGVPLRIVNVINRLGADYHHTILSLDGRYESAGRFEDSGVTECAETTVPAGGAVAMTRFAIKYLRATDPDILATYNWGAVEWALANSLLGRGRHVHFESGFGPEEADRQMRRRVWMRRVALKGASYLVVPSYTLERLARDVWRIDASKVRRVPNGIDVSLYQGVSETRSIQGVVKEANELIVGTVAPLRREKNLDRMLKAFADLPDTGRPVRLLIAGDGGERERLERIAGELGIADRTVFLGHIDAVEEALALMDVFVISSDTEQMPNALLQAMAAGRAVASVDVGDVAVIVAPENLPFVVPRDEQGVLRDAIDRLLRDDLTRAQVGRANLDHVQKTYSMTNMLNAYRAMYDGRAPETTLD